MGKVLCPWIDLLIPKQQSLSWVQSNGYNPAADRASWWALRGLLMESFGLTNMSNPYTATGGAYDYQTGINGQRLANAVAA